MAEPTFIPYDPTRRLPPGRSSVFQLRGQPEDADAFREWLRHVEAGRIGAHLNR